MRRRSVIQSFVFGAAAQVGVDQRTVVVRVFVIPRSVLELAQRFVSEMVGHVEMLVGMNDRTVRVLALHVDDVLIYSGQIPHLPIEGLPCPCRSVSRRLAG